MRVRVTALSFLIFSSIIALFAQVRGFSFINFDDPDYVTGNNYVNTGLKWENIHWAFTHFHSGHWHPLTWISHMIDVQLFGLEPGPHHLVNVGIHALNAVLLFLLLTRTTRQLGPSLFVALIFGLHPMRIESVAWVAERKDVLSVFFALLCFHSYVFYTQTSSMARYLLVVTTYVLGLLAKPTLVSIPILLLLFDIWPLQRIVPSFDIRFPWRLAWKLCVEKLPLVIFALTSCVVTIFSQDAEGGLKPLSSYPLPDRLAEVFTGYLAYAAKLFWPSGLGIFYPFQIYPPGLAAGSLLGLIAVTVWVIQASKRSPQVLVGWLWFLISLVPMIGFVQIGGQAFADRWSYLPHIGLLFALTWFYLDSLPSSIRRISTPLIVFLSICGCIVITLHNLPYWKDTITVWEHTLEVSPDNFMAYNNLGSEYDRLGDLQKAALNYERAVQVRPYYPTAVSNLGGVRARMGREQEAVELFQRALSVSPDFVPARYNLGLVYANTGNVTGALLEWLRVLALDPQFGGARHSIRWVMARLPATPENPTPNFFAEASSPIRRSLQAWRPVPEDIQIKEQLCALLDCSIP